MSLVQSESRASRAKILDVREQRLMAQGLEIREDSKSNQWVLEGYAATYEPYDCYGGVERGGWVEQIDPKAFEKTLRNSPDVQLLINHEGLMLARTTSGTLTLSVDNKGLKVRALLDRNDPDVQRIAPKMKRGDLNEMSFAFRVMDQVWSNSYEHRLITEVSLQRGDVSIVSYGMNPDTHAILTEEAVGALARMSADDMLELRKMDRTVVRKAMDALKRAASDPQSVSGNPKPNMQDSMMKPETEVETDPSDVEGSEIEAGIHDAPSIVKMGDTTSPVKMEIDPVVGVTSIARINTPMMRTMIAALASTISNAHSIAESNNDTARALIAEAAEQITKIADDLSTLPKPESDVERKLKRLREGDVGTSSTDPNPQPHPRAVGMRDNGNEALLPSEDAETGAGYADDDVLVEYSPVTIVGADTDDPANGIPTEGFVEEELNEYLIDSAEELPEIAARADDTDGHKPPAGVRAEAKRALEWIKEGHAGTGFTDVGRGRASDLAAGRSVSRETIGRIANYLARHEGDKKGKGWSPGDEGYPSPGRVAWAAWGGDPAKPWTAGILKSDSGEEKSDSDEFSVARALRELHEDAGVPVIESVSAGLEYLQSIKRGK